MVGTGRLRCLTPAAQWHFNPTIDPGRFRLCFWDHGFDEMDAGIVSGVLRLTPTRLTRSRNL